MRRGATTQRDECNPWRNPSREPSEYGRHDNMGRRQAQHQLDAEAKSPMWYQPRTSKSSASADRRSHATSQNSAARNPTAHLMSCTAAEHQRPVHVVPLVDDWQLGHATAMSMHQMHNQQLPLPTINTMCSIFSTNNIGQ